MSTNHFVTTTTANAAMEKHMKFWDRKNKGYITPVDTIFGFVHLGYGIVASVTIGTFLGVLLSYSTQDSWMPDPLCRTRMEKLQKNIQNEPYDMDGQLDLEAFDKLFSKHAKADISGKTITLKELLEWNEASYKDPLAWSTTTLEWLAIYLMVGNNGVVKKQDIQAAYDGTLFYQVRDRNKQHKTIKSTYDMSSSSSSNLNISGVMVPKSYVRQLETQLNNAVSILPRSTVLTLETRFRSWLSFVQQQQQHFLQQTQKQRQPILKGVVTPAPTRRSLFSNSGRITDDADDDLYGMDTTDSSASLFKGGLTGVMAFNLLDRPMFLTGVQGYEKQYGDDDDADADIDGFSHDGVYNNNGALAGLKGYSIRDDDGDDSQEKYGGNGNDGVRSDGYGLLSNSITGVRPEGEVYYRTSPQVDWLGSGQLTGVSPSASAASYLTSHQYTSTEEEEEDDDGDKDTYSNFRSMSLTGLQQIPSPPLTDMENDIIKDSQNHEKEDNTSNGKSHIVDACTPPFSGSPDSHEDDDDDDDELDSPNDATVAATRDDTTKHNNGNAATSDDALKDHMSRPPWPTLTEVVPSDD
ncbi:Caleosin related protein-domain-containing protein [Absidia repens]|uniref:Caleosin related protein-domain-containing protein n=1 Tax=Absidia repens TaxID=90262 RepID=A0A1X2IPY7_9FUNG|nr:Caleosin related protein-domain-containing protein [Absidia repens]